MGATGDSAPSRDASTGAAAAGVDAVHYMSGRVCRMLQIIHHDVVLKQRILRGGVL
jgi:hypothetical protein